MQEQALKHATRLESSDREDLETNLRKVNYSIVSIILIDFLQNYETLVRNLYAFGPLLIKYVDIHRSYWLKHSDVSAEELYNNMGEVFSIWCISKVNH